jgi:hypothetical protein
MRPLKLSRKEVRFSPDSVMTPMLFLNAISLQEFVHRATPQFGSSRDTTRLRESQVSSAIPPKTMVWNTPPQEAHHERWNLVDAVYVPVLWLQDSGRRQFALIRLSVPSLGSFPNSA